MKLSTANMVRSFLRAVRQECWMRKGCKGCAFWDEGCIVACPCEWDIEAIIAARERVAKKNEL